MSGAKLHMPFWTVNPENLAIMPAGVVNAGTWSSTAIPAATVTVPAVRPY